MEYKNKKKKKSPETIKFGKFPEQLGPSVHRLRAWWTDDSPPHKLSSSRISTKLQFPLSETPTLPSPKKKFDASISLPMKEEEEEEERWIWARPQESCGEMKNWERKIVRGRCVSSINTPKRRTIVWMGRGEEGAKRRARRAIWRAVACGRRH